MCGPDRVEQKIDRIGLPNIGDVRGCLETAARQLGDERIELGSVAPDHGDMRAQPREQPCDRPPDAAGTARYDDDLVLQRAGREHGRVGRKLFISQAELRRRRLIGHERRGPLLYAASTVH
jgi:hypothetical protein